MSGNSLLRSCAQITLLRISLTLARQKPLQNYHRGDAIKARILAAALSAFARKLRRFGARKALVLKFYLAIKIKQLGEVPYAPAHLILARPAARHAQH